MSIIYNGKKITSAEFARIIWSINPGDSVVLPTFDREKVFAAVDASNKRFEKYTRAERDALYKEARSLRKAK